MQKYKRFVDKYVTDHAKSLNQSRDDLEGIVSTLVDRLKTDEF
jgi:hypothetical protein